MIRHNSSTMTKKTFPLPFYLLMNFILKITMTLKIFFGLRHRNKITFARRMFLFYEIRLLKKLRQVTKTRRMENFRKNLTSLMDSKTKKSNPKTFSTETEKKTGHHLLISLKFVLQNQHFKSWRVFMQKLCKVSWAELSLVVVVLPHFRFFIFCMIAENLFLFRLLSSHFVDVFLFVFSQKRVMCGALLFLSIINY